MISKWFGLKDEAIKLRIAGNSIGYIESKLGIPRSTLSGWFKNIKLTSQQKQKLKEKMNLALIQSRKKAVLWHNNQKMANLRQAETEADRVIMSIDTKDKSIIELSLALLYLGEGSKNNTFSLGNSNPSILRFFITAINKVYGIESDLIKCDLHLRSDQDETEMINYWSKELRIPKKNFVYVTKDKRLVKSPTYSYYKGVCVVRYGKISIQRRLMFLSRKFCNIISG